MNQKNKILFPARLSQSISFEGLDIGPKMFPSDVDAVIEYKNIGYIFYEVKTHRAPVSQGQRIMLQRLAMDCFKNGKLAVVLVCDNHINLNTDEPINLASTIVREIYIPEETKWRKPKIENLETKQATGLFIHYLKKQNRLG